MAQTVRGKAAALTASALAAAVLTGCAVVREAREAQRDVAALGDGSVEVQRPERLPDVGTNLAEMVGYALGARPTMISAALAVQDARLAMKTIEASAPLASSTPWNAVSASGSAGYSATSAQNNFSQLKTKTKGDASATLSLDLLVWDFGRNRAQARAQAERVVAAELELSREGFATFAAVSEAYFTRLECGALLEVAFTNEMERAEHLKRAEGRLAAGEAQKLDVLRAQLDLAEAREAVVAASNDFVNAGAVLAKSLGLAASWGEEVIGIPPNLEPSDRPLDPTSIGADALFDFARTNAPAMQVARARLRAASADLDYALADLLPEVSASLSLNWLDPLWYWRWGVNGAQPLFPGFRRATAVERARVAMQTIATEVEEAELDLSRAITIAVNERDNAREALASAEASVRSARENLDTVSEQFAVGDVSRVEYTEAVADWANALASRVKAFYRGQKAEAALITLSGTYPLN
ncbi:MAG: TolC family protein [Kiritimatiellae bacterium]|nr:TolC family protein [Kiritimatiellia bacterium]